MKNIISLLKQSVLVVLISLMGSVNVVQAQVDLGLCPSGYSQGLVDTGFVECHRESGRRSTRAEAETDRLDREAICNATPNAAVTSSEIVGTSSGSFFSRITCTITRQIPPGTVLCPVDSFEAYRAFNTLVCDYFGSAVANMADAQNMLDEQTAACGVASGNILASSISEGLFDDETFFFSSLSCAIETAVVDVIECPFGFSKIFEDSELLQCRVDVRTFETLAEAQAANAVSQSICTDTTAGLGSVDSFLVGQTSLDLFFSEVICDITIPYYGDFSDSAVLRACDASCTELVEQTRVCLNGGVAGGPGCFGETIQEIERSCTTGPDPAGLCPFSIAPTILLPLVLDEEDE